MNDTNLYNTTKLQLVISRLIDNIIYWSIFVILYFLLKTFPEINESALPSYLLTWGLVIRWLIYYPLLEGAGGIIGKRIIGLKTVLLTTEKSASFSYGYKKAAPLISVFIVLVLLVLVDNLFTDNDMRLLWQGVCYGGYIGYCVWVYATDRHNIKAGLKVIIKRESINSNFKWQTTLPSPPKFLLPSIRKEVFNSKLAYLIYFVVAVLIILYAKYKFDVMKDERHFELKREYRDSQY